MSLFDGIPERAKQPKQKRSAIKSLPKTKKKSSREHGVNEHTTQKVSRDERRRITQAYERGELKFPDVSREFQLCYCDNNGAQTDSRFGHPYHGNEIAKFELEHHGRRK